MELELLDNLHAPGGREQVTSRPAWRVRVAPSQVIWAFVEERNGQPWVTGYPRYQVDPVRAALPDVAGFVVGAGAGIFIGVVIGGLPGAVLGGIIGALFGAAGGLQ